MPKGLESDENATRPPPPDAENAVWTPFLLLNMRLSNTKRRKEPLSAKLQSSEMREINCNIFFSNTKVNASSQTKISTTALQTALTLLLSRVSPSLLNPCMSLNQQPTPSWRSLPMLLPN